MEKLSLREQVQIFQTAYVRCIDSNMLEQWPDFFAEQCLYSVTTAENFRAGLAAGLMWANTRAMLHDRISALRHANVYERQAYRHILGQSSLIAQDDVQVQCETPFLVARIVQEDVTSLFATGVYHDVFELKGDKLLLRKRIVVCDSSRIDTLLAIPL
nr:aromatic-ring-hydroxylating dioxygenase subunit beta [Rhodoferax sp.]